MTDRDHRADDEISRFQKVVEAAREIYVDSAINSLERVANGEPEWGEDEAWAEKEMAWPDTLVSHFFDELIGRKALHE